MFPTVAEALAGGGLPSPSIQVACEKLASPQVLEFFSGRKLDESQLNNLKDKLQSIHVLAVDAELEQQSRYPHVRQWLLAIRDMVFEVEALLDEIDYALFECKVETESQTSVSKVRIFDMEIESWMKQVLHNLEDIASYFHALISHTLKWSVKRKYIGRPTWPRFGSKKQSIGSGHTNQKRDSVGSDLPDTDMYYLPLLPCCPVLISRRFNALSMDPLKLPPYNLELTDRVFGRQKEKDQVVTFLLDVSHNTNTKTNMSILGIVGPGGIGKTTLARSVYEHHKVRTSFQLTVWVTFPSYRLDAETLAKIILRILKVSFNQDDQLLDPMPRLQESLTGKRLLIVLDGCWSVHEWEKLQTCFESAARGSAIILTTRTTKAALQMLADHILHLSFLSMEHCWSLFSDHCFGNQSHSSSPQLEAMGKRILNKCGGVPLAAKMLGGLLHKKGYKVWEEIWGSQQWDSTNIDLPTPFVRLCYLDLPIQLKRCITYLAMFPKGYKFQKSHVVPLWMARGLIPQGFFDETRKNIGSAYFDFLVARSFLIRSNSGGNMDFTMHDMVRDLALFVSAKIHPIFDRDDESIDTSFLISNIQNVEESSSELYGSQMEEYIPLKDNTDIANITHGLDQQSPKIEVNIPTITNDAVQNRFEFETHFETLRIWDASQLVKLPSTLHSLRIEGCHFLESLQDVLTNRSTNLFELYIIDCCSLKYFTDGWYPTSLRTLYVHKCKKLELFLPIEKMQNFEFLENLFIGSSCDSLTSFHMNLFPRLKILCIWDCPNIESLFIEECQNSNLSLESLEIRDCSNLVSFPTQGLLSPNLRSLSVSNCKKLRSLPTCMTTLTSLQSVFVVKCPELESLPAGGLPSCLKLLSIAFCDKLVPQKDWNLEMLHCLHRIEIESGCVGMKLFPEKDLLPINLNSLYISKLQSLEVLDHNGLQQLTALESLEINCCKKLYSLPEFLPSSLTFLCIKESPMLSQMLLNQASTDWLKIAHICNIQIDNNVISNEYRIPVSSNTKRTSYHQATVSKFNIKNMPGALIGEQMTEALEE